MEKIKAVVVAATMAAMFTISFASAQTVPALGPGDIAVSTIHIDDTHAAHNLSFYLNSEPGKALVSAVAAKLGTTSAGVQKYLDPAATGVEKHKDEDSLYTNSVPAGYAFCAAQIATVSIVPIDGHRASKIGSNIGSRHGMGIYTWTLVRAPTEGRSWTEVNSTVIGIKPALLEHYQAMGICRDAPEPDTRLMDCQGHSCSTVNWGNAPRLMSLIK